MKRFSLLSPLLVLFLTILGCDRGVHFKPEKWGGDVPGTYVKKYDGFEITMGDIGVLV